MAVTEIWGINVRLDKFIAYVVNKDKTENVEYQALQNLIKYDTDELKTEKKLYVTGINCEPENAYKKMTEAYALNDKPMPVVAYHAYQSFKEGEVDAKIAHEIGVKMAETLWGNKFHVVVATHLNTGHYHNHFAICSTSFIDGSRYHDDKESKARMRAVSDSLCREYGLSVIEHRQYKREQNYAERMADKHGMPTLMSQMKADIDTAIMQSNCEEAFLNAIKEMGYTVTFRGNADNPIFSLVPPGYKHPWRPSNHFGEAYSYKGIVDRVYHHERQMMPLPEEKPKTVHLRHSAENFMKVTTLHAMYIHTLFQFGFIPKKSNKRVPIELREDLIKLDSIIAETRLLGRNHIDTAEQLSVYRGKNLDEIELLSDKRQKLRNRLRRCTDEDEIISVKAKVSDLSSEISKRRREVKLCDNIAVRSGVLKEKLTSIYEKEKLKGKDELTNEQFR